MRLLKLMSTIGAGVCVFAACGARAQSMTTNAVTFSVLQYQQENITTNATTTDYTMRKTPHNTAQFLDEIGKATIGTNFPKGAKLVLIVSHGSGDNIPTFAVINGVNFYDLSSNPGGSNIMNLSSSMNSVTSGTQSNDSLEQKTTQVMLLSVNYDDTAVLTTNGFAFDMQGLGTVNQTDTATNSAGIYTETLKASISSMSGQGTNGSGGSPFYLTGTLSVSGKGQLSQ